MYQEQCRLRAAAWISIEASESWLNSNNTDAVVNHLGDAAAVEIQNPSRNAAHVIVKTSDLVYDHVVGLTTESIVLLDVEFADSTDVEFAGSTGQILSRIQHHRFSVIGCMDFSDWRSTTSIRAQAQIQIRSLALLHLLLP